MVDEMEGTDSPDAQPPVIVPEVVAPVAEVEAVLEPPTEPAVPVEAVASPTFEQMLDERVKVGAILERTKTGWKVKLPHGGWLCLHGQGETLDAALKEAGA